MTSKKHDRRKNRTLDAISVVSCATLLLPASSPGQVAYTDKDAFLSALPAGAVVTNDWESDASSIAVPSGSSICQATLAYTICDADGNPLDVRLLDFFDTTTPNNYVGPESEDPRYALFLAGDTIMLDFDTQVFALGVQFVASPGTSEGVFHVTATIEGMDFTADSGPFATKLADDSEPFFVGVISDPGNAITDATMFSDQGLFSYSLDELIFLFRVPQLTAGDVNLDGFVDEGDIPGFVNSLLMDYTDPCDLSTADMNGDDLLDGLDVQFFVDLLT